MPLINKKNIKNVNFIQQIFRKSDLKDGDLCLQADQSFGVVALNPDRRKFNINGNGEPTILFLNDDDYIISSDWVRYDLENLTEDLKDNEEDSNYDILCALRGICNPKYVKDSKKLEEFLKDEDRYMKFFKKYYNK